MATVTYFGTGSRTVFPTPKSLANKTVTVAGVSAPLTTQDHFSVTLATAPGLGKAVVITTTDTDLETVSETSGGSPGFSSLTGVPGDNAALAAAIAAKADAAATTTALAAKRDALIAPRTEGATVTLAAADNGGMSITPVNCAVTVNTGLGLGFGRGFRGAGVVSFTGPATITDKRVTGAASPTAALVCTALDTYEILGGKA